MADVDDALAQTAVALNEDAKASRKAKKGGKAEPLPPIEENSGEQTSEGTGSVMTEEPSAVIEPPPREELAEALGSLGSAVASKNESYDLSEEAHYNALERMEAVASEYGVSARSLVPDVRDFLLDQIKARPKPWAATSKAEQQDVAGACEHAAIELVRKIVEAVAADASKQPIRCLLVGYTDKGDDIKVDLKLKTLSADETSDAVIGLHRAKGKHVLLTVASVDDYRADNREAEIDEDEPPLDFEAGSSEISDEDLANAGGEEESEDEIVSKAYDSHPLAHDDLVITQGGATGRVRIDLKAEMVNAEIAGENGPTEVELRPATPQELAAERDRIADFDDNGSDGGAPEASD